MQRDSVTQELIKHMQQRICSILDPLMAGASRCALVGFPNHGNSGDSAIWLGELKYLMRVGVMPAYVSDSRNYDMRDLRRSVPIGPILIHGGGNFGDLWPGQQRFREQVLRDFPERSFIQLPQTVTFTGSDVVDRMRRLAGADRRRLIVLCRDSESVAHVSRGLGIPAELCPDMAFMLGPLSSQLSPRADVVFISRRDHERRSDDIQFPSGLRVLRTDWLDASGHQFRRRVMVRTRTAVSSLSAAARGDSMIHRGARAMPTRFHRSLAGRRTANALRLLSAGSVVITDRLHGHILSLLLGKPHVLLPDRYGKIERFHRDFTAGSPLTHMASSPDEASYMASQLVAQVRATGVIVRGSRFPDTGAANDSS